MTYSLIIVLTTKKRNPTASYIKPEGKQHVVMETPMEEPAWKKISEKRPAT
jgi:transcription-repair coupling factor (superfamily II helicase)